VLALEALAREDVRAEIFNLGCGDGYTVNEVIDAARKITGRDIPVNTGARRAGDPAVLVASSDRITRALGWRPQQSSLEEIVGSAWKWETTFSQRGAAERDTESPVNGAGVATT
jgi:UDP-glucose 4-epimerase